MTRRLYRRALGAIATATTLGACSTTLEVHPILATAYGSGSPMQGWDYSLPFVQYEIIVTHRLRGCVDVPVIATIVSATPRYLEDPVHRYAIDHTSLSHAFKTSELAIERHPNGMLQRIGAKADDRTDAVLVNTATAVIQTAITIARLTSGVPSLPRERAAPRRETTPACTQAAKTALFNMQRTQTALERAANQLQEATSRWNAVREAVTLVGTRADAATQRALMDTAQALAGAKLAQERASTAHVNALDALTETRTLYWPPNGSTFAGKLEGSELSDAKLQMWTTGSLMPTGTEVSVRIERVPPEQHQSSNAADGSAAASPGRGIRYRTPLTGVLAATVGSATEAKLLAQGAVPQLGQMMVLPFTNGAFQQNSLSATFAEDGKLVTASYGELASRAERASSAAAQLASMGPQAVADIAGARNFGAQQATAQIRAEREVLQAEQERRVARAALAISPEDPSERRRRLLEADTALKNAERLNVEADIALREGQQRMASVPSVTR
ncbi:eukaryotic translation initiation factor 3 subunit J [Belnapia moabensis]|uniref:hypothetical protein n=1 Tax=Belnapia moabensis TaxID=365533 RepID=UPI0012EDC6C1|nr:hypothetical protein [Belnapia moabensis]